MKRSILSIMASIFYFSTSYSASSVQDCDQNIYYSASFSCNLNSDASAINFMNNVPSTCSISDIQGNPQYTNCKRFSPSIAAYNNALISMYVIQQSDEICISGGSFTITCS